MAKKIDIIKINKNRFKAFVMFTKEPNLISLFEELEHYSTADSQILGTITIDIQDMDFNCAILCRDETGIFRAVDIKTSIEKIEEAREWLLANMKWLALTEKFIHEQGGISSGVDLFKIVVSPDKIHPYFKVLNESKSFAPAKAILTELSKFFTDIDGNFVEQFQSSGFDSRLWELYMFCFLTEQGFKIYRQDERPDFIVNKSGERVGIEAVIVGRRGQIKGITSPLLAPLNRPPIINDFKIENEKKEMILKYSSALVQKLKMRYWELPNVANQPFILSIADFHDDLSMTWSFNDILEYLYGYKYSYYYNENSKLVIKPEKVTHYTKKNGSTVESGFFFLPECENVSGILFSSMGTLPKFTRMGIEAGFKREGINVLRCGTHYNHKEGASKPDFFSYEVNEKGEETWSEGMNLYHNPNAKFPIDKSLFQNIAHHRFENKFIVSENPKFHPFNSFQMSVQNY